MNLDRWFLRQVEVSISKGTRCDKTADCVDETFLKSYAEEPAKFSLADDRVEHVTICSYCMGCLLELRATQQATGSWRAHYIAVACLGRATLVVARISDFVLHYCRSAFEPFRSGKLRLTLDLSQQFATDAQLYLPAALMSVEIRLPETSQPGIYGVAVLIGGNSGDCVARTECRCKSARTVPRAVVKARLDLRNAVPGSYLLSTQCKGQGTSHLYPLQIGAAQAR